MLVKSVFKDGKLGKKLEDLEINQMVNINSFC